MVFWVLFVFGTILILISLKFLFLWNKNNKPSLKAGLRLEKTKKKHPHSVFNAHKAFILIKTIIAWSCIYDLWEHHSVWLIKAALSLSGSHVPASSSPPASLSSCNSWQIKSIRSSKKSRTSLRPVLLSQACSPKSEWREALNLPPLLASFNFF